MKCIVSFEKFPTLNIRDFNDDKEGVRCHNDKHIQKLYSSDSNMDPGSIPPALMASFYGFFYYLKLILLLYLLYNLHRLSEVEVMLISALMPISALMLISALMPICLFIVFLMVSIYNHNGHVVNLSQVPFTFQAKN